MFPKIALRFEPAVAAGAILVAYLLVSDSVSCAVAATLSGAAALTGFLLFAPRTALALTAAMVLTAGSFSFRQSRFADSGNYRHLLPERDAGGTARFRVTDARLTAVPGIPPPGMIRAELLEFTLRGDSAPTAATGTIYLLLPRDAPQRYRYGELVTGDGTFELPVSAPVIRTADGLEPVAESFDFAGYLAGRGASRVFRAEQLEPDGFAPGPGAALMRWRDAVLARVLEHVHRDSTRCLAAALFFGVTGGIDARNRTEFVRSGTIHLFSVSGMHVAVLAGILLLLLGALPIRIRYPLLLAVLGAYVATTGANAPALRAFFMIAVWALLRMALLRTPAENVLFLAAATLVIASPPLVLDIGFQYSFVITLVLILAAERFREASRLLGERFRFMPGGAATRRREQRQRRMLIPGFAVAGCTAAFLGGAAISLWTQGLLLPGSILANLLLMPLLALLFPLLLFKLLTGLFGTAAAAFGARLFDGGFVMLETITQFAAECFGNLAAVRPAAWEILLFYAGLFAFLGPRSRGVRIAGAGAVMLLFASWLLRVELQPPVLIAGYGGNTEIPFVAVAEPGRGLAFAWNAPDYESSRVMSEFLRRRGLIRFDAVALTRYRAECISGLPKLATLLPINRIVLPEYDRFGRRALDRLELALPEISFTAAGRDGEMWKIIDRKESLEIAYFNPGSMFKFRMMMNECDAGWRLTLRHPDGSETTRLIAHGSVLESWEHEFR